MVKNFFRKGLIIAIVLLFVGASFSPSTISSEVPKTQIVTTALDTITVDDEEGDGDYSSIQEAVNASKPGDTIEVYSGIYKENVLVEKELKIIGNNSELGGGDDSGKPIIDGGGLDNVISIYFAEGVEIIGFYIRNSGTCNGAGIYVHFGHDVVIWDNDIENCHSGIFLFYTHCLYSPIRGSVAGNIIRNNYRGVYLHDAIHVDVKDNTITNNSFQNIAIATSSGCMIEGNIISDGGAGIFIENSGGIIIKNNIFKHNVWVDKNTGKEQCLHADVWNCRNQWISNSWDAYQLGPFRRLLLSFGWFVIFGNRWWASRMFRLPIIIQIDFTARLC